MKEINEIYAFFLTDAKDREILAAVKKGNDYVPLIAANKTRLKVLQPLAKQLADSSGMPIKLVRYTGREEINVIAPSSSVH